MTPFDSAQGRRIKENRELIGTELDQTLIVEAAAGTGKTTELVRRIVALIANERATIGQIVAVTFSEKAAGELKLRLREELEREREDAGRIAAGRLLDDAVHDFEEAQVSTIHGFCAELLRERPVEARVDPSFAVLTDPQSERFFDEAFSSWLHAELANPQEGVRRSLRRPVKWRFGDETEDGPIERLRAAAAACSNGAIIPHPGVALVRSPCCDQDAHRQPQGLRRSDRQADQTRRQAGRGAG